MKKKEKYYISSTVVRKDIVTGITKICRNNVSINPGKVDAMLNENEQVREKSFVLQTVLLYALEVKDTQKVPDLGF